MMDYFMKKLLAKSLNQEDRLNIYYELLTGGEFVVDDVLKFEQDLDTFITIDSKDELFNRFLRVGYSINNIRKLDGEEPVGYGNITFRRP